MSKEKNLVLITVDCLRPDHMSCFGYHRKTTPCIDNFAREGALFHQAISNGPNTYCSFPSIMTSSYVMMNSLGREMGYPLRWIFLSEKNVTIAEVLQRRGYSTVAFHSNPWVSSFFHYDRGFTFFDDSLNDFRSSDFLKDLKMSANVSYNISQLIGLFRKLRDKGDVNARWLRQKAISRLTGNEEKFFLWVHYMDVHAPLIPPGLTLFQRIAAIKLDYKIRRNFHVSRNELITLIELYDKEVEFVDQEIGLFVKMLEEIGISFENTYFVITADHGEQLMEHGHIAHGLLYDEIIRVPLIIIGPGVESGTVVEDQASLLDLAPTITDLLGVGKVKNFWGTSLVPMMRGQRVEKAIISENLTPTVSLRAKNWKCIASFDGKKSVELYNLKEDPYETQNLAAQQKEIRDSFVKRIANHIRMEEAFRRRPQEKKTFQIMRSRRDQEQLRTRLKALGYS